MSRKFYLILFLLFISIIGPAFTSSSAHAFFIIDGNINDWGVILNQASQTKGYLDTHTPTGGNDIDYQTEDNADKNSGSAFVGPGWTSGNRYDAEAIYFDNDHFNAYIAIITGLPSNETVYPSGDIFIDTGKYQNPSSSLYNPAKYEFAINVLNGKLYSVGSWRNVLFAEHAASNPWKIGENKTLITDNIDFRYGSPINTHYVLEAGIPLQNLGLEEEGNHDIWLHWTMLCGNDHLNLHGDVNVAPEPGTLSLFLSGIGFTLTGLRKKLR